MKIAKQISALILFSSFLNGLAYGFDTGPHQDLTRSVMTDRGFGDVPIKITAVENWLTDYYSSRPQFDKERKAAFEKLHFDNLYTSAQVDAYWATFTNNLRAATQDAARSDDKLAMFVVMGIGLHAVQDFYSHSNWVETHPRPADGSYRTDTYIGSRISVPLVAVKDLHTGKYPTDRKSGPGTVPIPPNAAIHGDYNVGINHDSPSRARWDEAYVFAYCASHEMMAAFEKWSNEARPGFWEGLKTYRIDSDQEPKLEYDVAAARNISMWIKEGKDINGHWKGPGSGSSRFFTAFSGKWVASDSSAFVRATRDSDIQIKLARGLYTNASTTNLPSFERFSLRKRAVMLRVIYVGNSPKKELADRLRESGGSDFYLRSRIAGQDFWGRTVQNADRSDDPWFEIAFVDQSAANVDLRLAVFDENDIDLSKDSQADISPIKNQLDLGFSLRISDSMLSGDLSGIFSSRSATFTSEGAKPDRNLAVLKGFVTSSLLK